CRSSRRRETHLPAHCRHQRRRWTRVKRRRATFPLRTGRAIRMRRRAGLAGPRLSVAHRRPLHSLQEFPVNAAWRVQLSLWVLGARSPGAHSRARWPNRGTTGLDMGVGRTRCETTRLCRTTAPPPRRCRPHRWYRRPRGFACRGKDAPMSLHLWKPYHEHVTLPSRRILHHPLRLRLESDPTTIARDAQPPRIGRVTRLAVARDVDPLSCSPCPVVGEHTICANHHLGSP